MITIQGEIQLFTTEISSFQAKIFKGSIYGAFRRDFVEFILNSKEVQPITNFLMKTKRIKHPDEFFWPTIAYNPELGAPGGCFTKNPDSEQDLGFLARYVIWGGSPSEELCRTMFVRDVCILGSVNIKALKQAPHLFANKFYENFEPAAYDEMERWYFEKTAMEWSRGDYSHNTFDASASYGQLQCSKNHLP